MRFVWTLKESPNDEVRYSIRSVLKFHPDAEVFIIGDVPDWYSGEFHRMKPSGNRYADKWQKMLIAMDWFDEFIQMDDDFFLREPFKVAHYYHGKIIDKARHCKRRITRREELIYNTYELFPDANNYMLHIPLPVCSKAFKPIDRFVSFRQYYCSLESKYERIEHKDVKIRAKTEGVPDAPFFSTGDKIYINLQQMYPDASYLENDYIKEV